jgi:hypothetical protein
MFTVKNHPSRGYEVDLAAKITRLQLHSLQIKKMTHSTSHPLDAFAIDHTAENLARRGLVFRMRHLEGLSSFPSSPEKIKPAHQRPENIRFLHSGSRKMSVMAVTSNR